MSLVEPGKPEHRLELFGSMGALMIDGTELWQSAVGEGAWRRVEIDRGELASGMPDVSWARGFTAFSKRIVEALREGRTTVEGAATFADGYRTQLALDAARRANESKCWARVE
jgi:predicted dehydrogenase